MRVEVRAKGAVTAWFAAPNSKQIHTMVEPLVIRPMGELQYYDKRAPVDIWSFVKSPYGIMIVFSVFIIFIFPMMKVRNLG